MELFEKRLFYIG
ncbi:putative membrane protein, partial [Vibrio cholerae O1 str. 116059]